MDGLRLIEPCSGRVEIILQMENGERVDSVALSTGFWAEKNGEIKLNSWIEVPESIEDRAKEIAFLISGCENVYQVIGGELDPRQGYGIARLVIEAAN